MLLRSTKVLVVLLVVVGGSVVFCIFVVRCTYVCSSCCLFTVFGFCG